jgi:hypothetical protein
MRPGTCGLGQVALPIARHRQKNNGSDYTAFATGFMKSESEMANQQFPQMTMKCPCGPEFKVGLSPRASNIQRECGKTDTSTNKM